MHLCAVKDGNVQVCHAPGRTLLGWITFMGLESLPLVALVPLGNSTFLKAVLGVFWWVKLWQVLVQTILEMQQCISIYIQPAVISGLCQRCFVSRAQTLLQIYLHISNAGFDP